MNITEAQEILVEARAWYKGDMKSSNKRYQPAPRKRDRIKNWVLRREQVEKGASKQRRDQRNRDASAAGVNINLLRNNPIAGTTYDGRGAHIFNNNIRYGNCHEMACLTAHLVRNRFPSTRIFIAHLSPPGDHTFVCVNSAPLGTRLNNISDNDCIVIDPWMNVCCEVRLYESAARDKLSKWTSDGKVIIGDGGPISPTSGFYTSSLFHSALVVEDTSGTDVLSGTSYGGTFLLD